MPFVVYRVQKLAAGSRGAGTLGQSLRHLAKHSESAEIAHPERSGENMLQMAGDYKKAMRHIEALKQEHNAHHVRGFRSDAAVACEMVFSYSPKVRTGKKDKQGKDIEEPFGQSLEYAREYEKRLLAFIREQFPDMQIFAVARHADEESYHWHIIGVCFNKDTHTLSVRQCIGGPKDLQKQQSRLAELCQDIGLTRGVSKAITKSNHLTKAEHNRRELIHQQELHAIEKAHRAKIIEEGERAARDVLGDFDR